VFFCQVNVVDEKPLLYLYIMVCQKLDGRI